MKNNILMISSKQNIGLQSFDLEELPPDQIRGKTLFSLISPGTELSSGFCAERSTPTASGYAAVFEVTELGSNVRNIQKGEIRLAQGNHKSIQHIVPELSVLLPSGLSPDKAAIARLMGVAMTTLMTTKARPGDIVFITGAGPVGYLAAQLFKISAYRVFVVEPDEKRRKIVEISGIEGVFASMPLDNPEFCGKVSMVIDCSGHEQAVLNGCQIVRRGGEVVLVGVPWRKQTDLFAFDLLAPVFRKFVTLRTGWEWELPLHSDNFNPHGVYNGFQLALKWLNEDRIPLDGVIRIHSPHDAQQVYQSLVNNEAEGLFQIFDWSK